MIRLAMGLGVLLATSMPAQAAVSGAELSGWCDAWVRVFVEDRGESDQDVADAASCSAFIAGVLEGASALNGQIFDSGPGPVRSPGLGLCHPREGGYPPLIEAVRNYLSRESRADANDAATIVLQAVQESFPCKGA